MLLTPTGFEKYFIEMCEPGQPVAAQELFDMLSLTIRSAGIKRNHLIPASFEL